jgi:hypothetical protein
MKCDCGGENCRLVKGDERHGLSGSYRNYGCRCTRCRRAWAMYWRQWVHADPVRYERIKRQRRERYRAKMAEKKRVKA